MASDAEIINIAREWLGAGDDVSDQEVAEFIAQNKYENQIEFYLAVQDTKETFLKAMEPVIKSISEAYGRLIGER